MATSATPVSPPVCGKRPDGSFAAAFLAKLRDATFQISIAITQDYTGPGSYVNKSVGSFGSTVTFVFRDTGTGTAFGSESGLIQVSVGADERSGTVDGDYAVFDGSQTPVGHVTGAWRCST